MKPPDLGLAKSRFRASWFEIAVVILLIALSACSPIPEPQSDSERLTQADLDKYISALSDPALAETDRAKKTVVAEVLKRHGLTEDQSSFIYIKIFMCQCIIDEESDPDFECDLSIFDKDSWPDETEVELYRNNAAALKRAEEIYFQHRRG